MEVDRARRVCGDALWTPLEHSGGLRPFEPLQLERGHREIVPIDVETNRA